MTAAARELLTTFDALPPAEQRQVAAEIQRRSVGPDALPEEALHELAVEIFRGYDAEEAARAEP